MSERFVLFVSLEGPRRHDSLRISIGAGYRSPAESVAPAPRRKRLVGPVALRSDAVPIGRWTVNSARRPSQSTSSDAVRSRNPPMHRRGVRDEPPLSPGLPSHDGLRSRAQRREHRAAGTVRSTDVRARNCYLPDGLHSEDVTERRVPDTGGIVWTWRLGVARGGH